MDDGERELGRTEHAAELAADGALDSSAGGDATHDDGESRTEPVAIELPLGANADEVVFVELMAAPDGTPMFPELESCVPTGAVAVEDVAAQPEWQDPRYDNDRVAREVEAWLEARPDPAAPWSEAEELEYAAMWRPASPDDLARAAAELAVEPPRELIVAYEDYAAWRQANPDATVEACASAKAAFLATAEVE